MIIDFGWKKPGEETDKSNSLNTESVTDNGDWY